MSLEDDSSEQGSNDRSQDLSDIEEIGTKRGRRPSKKKKETPLPPSFRASGPPTAEGWGIIQGFVASATVQWSDNDLCAIFNVARTTLRAGLARKPGE